MIMPSKGVGGSSYSNTINAPVSVRQQNSLTHDVYRVCILQRAKRNERSGPSIKP